MLKIRLACLLGSAACVLPQLAWAQAQVQEESGLAEITVTATRRSELLKNVPVAVTAVNGEEVAARHIENFSDVVKIAPGPTFVPIKGTSVISVQIRGQYSANDATALEVPIGVFIDDIYYASLASFDADFFDVDQIALLRGPQGTTFGRNVVGGALQITSKRPEMGVNAGHISVTGLAAGDHPGFETQGFYNAAFSNVLAGRLAFSGKEDEGYMHNLIDGKNLADNRVWSGRGSLTWQASDDLKMTAIAYYSARNNLGDGPRVYGMGSQAARLNAASSDFHDVMVDDDGHTRRDIFSGQLHIDWDMPLGTVTSITGYRTLNAYLDEDPDGGPYPLNNPGFNTNNEYQFSEEIRLASPAGRTIEYLTGVYYDFENLKHSILFTFNGTFPQSYLSVLTRGTIQPQLVTGVAHTQSVGPFVEAKWHIFPELTATAGVRYIYEDKNGYTEHDGSSVFYGAGYSTRFGGSWSTATPRFILEYKPSEAAMIYASASNGFQGGGWTLTARTAAAARVPLQPEDTWSYEAGAKTNWFDGKLVANAALYLATTSNLQVRSLINGVLSDTNAGQERVKGIELETAARPAKDLTVGLNYAFTDARYSRFPGCAVGVSCTGNKVPFTPMNDLTVYLNYAWHLPNAGVLNFHIDDKNASRYQLVATNTQQSVVPLTSKNNLINTSLTFEPEQGNWSAQLWVKNLLDRRIVTNGLAYYFYLMSPQDVAAAGGAAKSDAERITVAPPRTIGVTLTYDF